MVNVKPVGLNEQLAQGARCNKRFLTPKQALKIIGNTWEYLHDGFRIKYPDGGPCQQHLNSSNISVCHPCSCGHCYKGKFFESVYFFLCLDFLRVSALDCKEQIRLLQVQSAVWIASQFERVCDRCTWN